MSSKRIIFLADSLTEQKAGIHYFAKEFINYITQKFPDNTYLSITSKSYIIPNVENIVIPINSIPGHYRFRNFVSIPKAVKSVNADIVIELAHFGPFNLPAHIKRVTIIHDLTPLTNPEWHNPLSYWAHKLLLPYVLKNADAIIINSESTRKDLKDWYPNTQGKTFKYMPGSKFQNTDLRPDLHLNSDNYIFSVGTIEPRKNYAIAIESFEALKKEIPDLKWKIAGYIGWKSKPFIKRIQGSIFRSDIELLGYVDDTQLIQLYKNAKTFLWLSHKEGLGMPLIDALHFGKAILSNKIPSAEEVCQDSCIYFHSDNIVELTKHLKEILISEKLRKQLETNSKMRYVEFVNSPQQVDILFESMLL